MTERISQGDFARDLLAQEQGVSEEIYAAHRRQLDERLALQVNPRIRVGKRLRLVAAAVVLLGLGVAVYLAIQGKRAGLPRDFVILRSNTDPAIKRRDRTPYELTAQASLVALATTQKGVRHQGKSVVPLHIDRVLKDETRQEPPSFGCSFDGPEPTSTLLPPDTRLVVYLTHDEQGWSLIDLRPLNESFEKRELPGIIRCVEVLNATRSDDPARQYARLLAPEAGGLDVPACSALVCRPDPRSADVLLAQLKALQERIPREGIQPQPVPNDVDSLPDQLLRLATVLAKMYETRAAVSIAECARRCPRGRRGVVYAHLPALCQSAPAAVVASVRRLLSDEVEDPSNDTSDVRVAVTVLTSLGKELPSR
jgi:hypothetical protein